MNLPGVKEATEAVLKWLDNHLAFRYFALLLALSAVFLFGINPILSMIGLPAIEPAYRVIAVACSLLSATGCVFFAVESGCHRLRKTWNTRKLKQSIELHLRSLPDDQRDVLIKYLEFGNRTSVDFQMKDGAVRDLERRGILYRSSNEGTLFEGFPFTLTPIAQELLQREEFRQLVLDT